MAKSASVAPIVYETRGIGDHAEISMITYGSYVIFERALVDVRDGLKPVQRRILYTMFDSGLSSNKAHKKCADTVGRVMGRFHPHGDKAIYDTLVNMTTLRYPLVDGSGNFGDDFSEPAAHRYTEARLTPLAESAFDQIHIVPKVPNYDGTDEEPLYVPAKLPFLLINGTSGVAVAVRGAVPAHNLGEIVGACVELLDNPEATTKQLMEHIRGPDFGYGILLSSKKEIEEVYETGKGSLRYRCHYKVVDNTLEITSQCPGFAPVGFLVHCQKLVDEGLLTYCSNQTAENFHVLIGFSDPKILADKVLPKLSASESYQFWTVVRSPDSEQISEKTVKQHTLKSLLQEFLAFREVCETKTLESERAALSAKRSRLFALSLLAGGFEETKKTMERGSSKAEAVGLLFELAQQRNSEGYEFSREDVEHVLDSPIWSLARVSREKVKNDIQTLTSEIARVDKLLKNVKDVIRQSLLDLKERFGDKRGTSLTAREQVLDTNVSYVMGVRSNGVVARDFDNRARVYYDFALPCSESIVVVRDKTHKATVLECAYTPQLELGADVVGVFKSDDLYFAAIFESGLGVWCQPAKNDFFVSKSEEPIISVAGVGEGESIAFIGHDGSLVVYPSSTFQADSAMRRGSKPAKIDGLSGAVRSVAVLRIPVECELVDDRGIIKGKSYQGRVFVVGEKNYVLKKDGKKGFLSRKEVLDDLSSIERTQPL